MQDLAEELPLVPKDTTDAVLFLGLDDLRYLGMGATPLDETITANAAIVAKLHARGIRVYQVLIRDYMKDPMFHPQPRDLEALPHVSYSVKRLNAAYRAPSVKIIDAPSWADVYKGAWSSGGIHFEAVSLKLFARQMAEALR